MPSAKARRSRGGEQGDVARRALEQERQTLGDGSVGCDPLEPLDHHQIGIVGQREPRHIGAERTRHERRGPGRDAAGRELVSPHARRCDGIGQRRLVPDGLGEQQLMPAEPGQAPPDPDEPVELRPVPRCEQHRAAIPGRRRKPRMARTRESGVLLQDPGLELLERGRGLEAERLDQGRASRAELLERLGLAAGAVERDHQLAAQALVQRVFRDELLELWDESGAAPELELRFQALLRDRQAQVAQALDDRPRERLEHEICERLATPYGERVPVEPHGLLGVTGCERRTRCLGAPFEVLEIECVRCDHDAVAGWSRLDHRARRTRSAIRLQQCSQLRDLPVHLRDGADRRRLAVQLVGEAVDRHDPIRVEQQDRQHRTLPRATKADRPGRRIGLERAEDAEGELQAADRSAAAAQPTGSRPVAAAPTIGASRTARGGIDHEHWTRAPARARRGRLSLPRREQRGRRRAGASAAERR